MQDDQTKCIDCGGQQVAKDGCPLAGTRRPLITSAVPPHPFPQRVMFTGCCEGAREFHILILSNCQRGKQERWRQNNRECRQRPLSAACRHGSGNATAAEVVRCYCCAARSRSISACTWRALWCSSLALARSRRLQAAETLCRSVCKGYGCIAAADATPPRQQQHGGAPATSTLLQWRAAWAPDMRQTHHRVQPPNQGSTAAGASSRLLQRVQQPVHALHRHHGHAQAAEEHHKLAHRALRQAWGRAGGGRQVGAAGRQRGRASLRPLPAIGSHSVCAARCFMSVLLLLQRRHQKRRLPPTCCLRRRRRAAVPWQHPRRHCTAPQSDDALLQICLEASLAAAAPGRLGSASGNAGQASGGPTAALTMVCAAVCIPASRASVSSPSPRSEVTGCH